MSTAPRQLIRGDFHLLQRNQISRRVIPRQVINHPPALTTPAPHLQHVPNHLGGKQSECLEILAHVNRRYRCEHWQTLTQSALCPPEFHSFVAHRQACSTEARSETRPRALKVQPFEAHLPYQYFQRGTTCSSNANGSSAPGVTTTRTQPTLGDPGTCMRVRFSRRRPVVRRTSG